MTRRINIGILGCAKIAGRSVIPAMLELPDLFKVSGIASRTIDGAEQFADKFRVTPVANYGALLEQEHIDAVYIPLPNALHAEWIKNALVKGLHVLVEKSLACNLEEVEQLSNIAFQRNKILVENFQFRFHRQLVRIFEIIRSGELGELRCIRSSFGFPPFQDPGNIRYQKALGGGALLDAGAYPIKISQLILGSSLEVKAAALSYDSGKSVDISGGGFIQQKNGALFSQIAFGFDHYYQCCLELWGSKGRLFTNRIFTAPPDYEAIITIETAEGKRAEKIPVDNHFRNMLIHFHELIADKKDPKEEYQQNINQARLIASFNRKAHE